MKIKVDIAVVILHYNLPTSTVECVDSLVEKLGTTNYVILIFDNCSPDSSGKILKTMFSSEEKIIVYLSEKNIGFSKGNNKGIQILREKYEWDFLILCNNDVLLLGHDLFSVIKHEYKKSHFAELGLKVYNLDGKYDSNPLFDFEYDLSFCRWKLGVFRKQLLCYKLHIEKLYFFVQKCLNKFFRRHQQRFIQNRISDDPRRCLIRRENVILHGCFMVFSNTFFDYFDGIESTTFMYGEEDILFQQIKRKKLKTVYLPSFSILHKESSSVDHSFGKNRKGIIFKLTRFIEAEKYYLQYMKYKNYK